MTSTQNASNHPLHSTQPNPSTFLEIKEPSVKERKIIKRFFDVLRYSFADQMFEPNHIILIDIKRRDGEKEKVTCEQQSLLIEGLGINK